MQFIRKSFVVQEFTQLLLPIGKVGMLTHQLVLWILHIPVDSRVYVSRTFTDIVTIVSQRCVLAHFNYVIMKGDTVSHKIL